MPSLRLRSAWLYSGAALRTTSCSESVGAVVGVPVSSVVGALSCTEGKENVGSGSAVVGGATEPLVGTTGGGCTGCSCVTGGLVGACVVFCGSGALLIFVADGVTVVVTVVTGSVWVGVGVGSVVVIVTVVTTSVGSQLSPASHGGTTSPASGSLATTDALATWPMSGTAARTTPPLMPRESRRADTAVSRLGATAALRAFLDLGQREY